MQTNFFRQIAKMNLTGDLQITIRPTQDNRFVISVLLSNEQCGDEARKLIPPLNLRGTAEDLDNGFFENVATPMQTASGLMVDNRNARQRKIIRCDQPGYPADDRQRFLSMHI